MIYEIRVYGIPKGAPRPRATRRGNHAAVYMPDTDRDWKSAVRDAVRIATPKPTMLSGPLRIDVDYYFPRPKSVKSIVIWHTKKPDRDNCDKATLDALVQAGAIADDKLVCDGRIRKEYAGTSAEPGAWITIEELATAIVAAKGEA